MRKFAHQRFEPSGHTLNPQIARALSGLIPNHGVGVVVEAEHLCMKMRGIQKQNSRTMASGLLGKFRDDSKTRLEFLTLIQPFNR